MDETMAQPGTILVVDDTPDNLRLLAAILAEQGYRVRKALNGPTALKTAQASPPDLILLDITMPGMNGYEVCGHLKAQTMTQDIPVIFISALDDILDKVRAFQVGGVDYITKPFQAEEVLIRVAHQMTIQRQRRQLQDQNLQLQQEIQDRRQAEAALRVAQQRAHDLLLNILPGAVVEELQSQARVTPVQYAAATFLFADIVGFTARTHGMAPAQVVDLLNQIFSSFDHLTAQYDLEKIRTIGDSYFVAGGIPRVRPDHGEAVATLALEMQRAIARFQWQDGSPVQLRIGINTGGPVVAAVIGVRKFAYDVWGDAVNLASRMESQGEPGRIQVSTATYEHLKGQFNLVPRGAIAIKGRGMMTTYWLTP